MTDDDNIDITQLEARIFPDGKPPGEMTDDDFTRLSAAVDALVDQYGQERIESMLRELTALTGAQIRAMLDERES